jgi:hypothetical protein
MIEVLALASAVSTIAGGISSAIQAGKDVNSIMPAFGKLASLEAEISIAESGRHKGPLGRLTSSEEEGFAIAQAKMKHKEVMDELRSVCRLFGPPGMWEIVVREQTAARIRRQKILDDEAEARDQFFWRLSIALGIFVFIGAASLMFWGASFFVVK